MLGMSGPLRSLSVAQGPGAERTGALCYGQRRAESGQRAADSGEDSVERTAWSAQRAAFRKLWLPFDDCFGSQGERGRSVVTHASQNRACMGHPGSLEEHPSSLEEHPSSLEEHPGSLE